MPYARTIRTFKEGQTRKGVFDQLFACFYQFLKNNNPLKDIDVTDAPFVFITLTFHIPKMSIFAAGIIFLK